MNKKKENLKFATLPTKHGNFVLYVWKIFGDQKEPVALTTKKIDPRKPVMVRIHSECFTGDVLGGKCCDCGSQKEYSLKLISQSKNGLFIYDRQEGRGIGLFSKIEAMKLQENGLNTYQANKALGHPYDLRNYEIACIIMDFFKVKKIRLITNNPKKIKYLEKNGFKIVERIPIIIKPNKHNKRYLEAKKNIGRHML